MKEALEGPYVPQNDTITVLKCNKERVHEIFPEVVTGRVL